MREPRLRTDRSSSGEAPIGAPVRDECGHPGVAPTKHGMRSRFRIKTAVTPKVRLWCCVFAFTAFFAVYWWSDIRVVAHVLQSPDHDDFFNDLVFFNDTQISAHLGCPHAPGQDNNFACFYKFSLFGQPLNNVSTSRSFSPAVDCWAIRRPLPADYGRPWCIRKGRAPSWLEQHFPKPWPKLSGTTLVMGDASGPNPTHALNLNFYHMYRWMNKVSVPMGTLHMIFDTPGDEGYTPGQYGEGLAAAFGHNHGLLRNMPPVTQLQRVKFSVGGGFQFDMNMLQSDTPVLCDYLQMAAHILKHYKLKPFQEADPKRILIATRKESESRRLLGRVPAYNPELANQARNYGKVLRSYYSPFNATLYMDEATGKPVDAPPVRQSKLVPVDQGGLVAAIQGTIKASDETMFQGLQVAAASTGPGIVCKYDRPVPRGILYGCDSPQYQGC
ncbi:hypothetical protein WJX79_001785 [Trebouxia sp. C0005]